MDDIYTIYHKCYSPEYQEFKTKLMAEFTINPLGNGEHFLGIQIARDQINRRTTIVQDSYIDKLASKYYITTTSKPTSTPLPNGYLEPNDRQATKVQIHSPYEFVAY